MSRYGLSACLIALNLAAVLWFSVDHVWSAGQLFVAVVVAVVASAATERLRFGHVFAWQARLDPIVVVIGIVSFDMVLILAGMTVTGWKQDYHVSVTSVRGRVMFVVPKSEPHCLERITVYAATDRARPIWLIDTSEQQRCTTLVNYGVVPKGFDQRGSVERLQNGKLYVVVASRAGATAMAFFEPGHDGFIGKAPPGP